MAKRTNGTPKNRFEIKYTDFRELGYVVIQADEKRPPEPDMLADLLSKSVNQLGKTTARDNRAVNAANFERRADGCNTSVVCGQLMQYG